MSTKNRTCACPDRSSDRCVYRYQATGELVLAESPGQTSRTFWRNNRQANTFITGTSGSAQITWLRAAGAALAEQVQGNGARSTLLAGSMSGSVLLEVDASVRTFSYAPHGHREDEQKAGAQPAFNGEMLDAVSGYYLLGPGHHRPYSPRLTLFLAPDRASPFARGGLNTLAYCAGDPINRADPSGHFLKWVLAGVALVVGVAAVAVSFGTASAAVGALWSGGITALTASGVSAGAAAASIGGVGLGAAGLLVDGTALAMAIAGEEKTAEILGWVSFGFGVAGMAPGVAKAAIKGGSRIASRSARFNERLAARARHASDPGGDAVFRNPLARAAQATDAQPTSGMALVDMPASRAAPGSVFRNPLAQAASPRPGATPGVVRQVDVAPRPELSNGKVIEEMTPSWTARHSQNAQFTFDGGGDLSSARIDSHLRQVRRVREDYGNGFFYNEDPPGYDDLFLPRYEDI